MRKIPLGEQIDYVEYFTTCDVYALGASQKLDFKLPEDDEIHTEWRNEGSSMLVSNIQVATNTTM